MKNDSGYGDEGAVEDDHDRLALPHGYQLKEYQIQGVLGQGGFGITYLAHDERLDRDVAIKEFLPSDLAIRHGDSTVAPRSTRATRDYNGGLDRFLKEARTLAQFSHPNIVRIFTSFEANGTAYIVMAYEAGESLGAWLKAQGLPLAFDRLLAIAEPLLDGLARVHDAGFWHRDIKPSNIFLRADGTPVLLDFGTARQAIGNVSRVSERILTPHYAPYEQYIARGNQGPWTDIYAIGAVLYYCITGCEPPEATERVHAEAEKQPDPLKAARSVGHGRYPSSFLSAIDQCLAVWPKDRLQSVTDLRRALIQSRPHETSPSPSATSPIIRRLPVLALGGGALLVAVGLSFAVFKSSSTPVVVPSPQTVPRQPQSPAQPQASRQPQIPELQQADVQFTTAREAIRVSTDYGRQRFKRSRLQDAIPSAERLAKANTRYQKQLDDIHQDLNSLDNLTESLLQQYHALVNELAKFPDRFEQIKGALSALELPEAGKLARQQLIEHVEARARGPINTAVLQTSLNHSYAASELW